MTAGKRQPPLWLDMSFAEALERFAGTDPKEMAAEPDKKTAAPTRAAVARGKGLRKRLVQAPPKDADPQ